MSCPDVSKVRVGAILAVLLGAALTPYANATPPAEGRAPVDPRDAGRLVHRVYTDHDGLPQNSIEAIALDAEGYLWVGTRDGIARFDGRAWQREEMPERQRSSWVHALAAGADGSLWVGTEGAGVHRLHEGRWSSCDSSSGLPSDRVSALLADTREPKERVLVGTERGLAAADAEGCRALAGPVEGLGVTALALAGEALLAGTTDGVWRLDGAGWSRAAGAEDLPSPYVRCLLTEAPPSRGLWVGTDEGLARFDPKTGWRTMWTAAPVRGLAAGRDVRGARVVWAATEGGGLVRFDGRGHTVLGSAAGIPNRFLYSLLAIGSSDGVRTLFVGTLTGLAHLEFTSWVSFDSASGLPDDTVVSLLETDGGSAAPTVWFGTTAGGLARLAGGRWQVFDRRQGLPDDSVFCLLHSAEGLLAGTDRGLARLAGGHWRPVPGPSQLHAPVVALAAGTGDELWVGTYGAGLLHRRAGRWQVIDRAGGALPDDRIEAVLHSDERDGRDIVWVATDGGLVRLDGDAVRRFDSRHGLPNDVVRSLHLSSDPSGRRTLWVGTGAGIAWTDPDVEPTAWAVLTESTTPGLDSGVVYRIEEDREGSLYLTTNRGVARVDFLRRPPGSAADLRVTSFTTADGLPSNECSFGASMVDNAGRVWVGTVAGAAVFDPASAVPDTRAKPLHLVRADVAGRTEPLRPGESLDHRHRNVTFGFTLLSFFRAEDARFTTRLEGFDAEPSPWSPGRTREYTNLPPGRYRFLLWGRDHAGNVSGPLAVPFAVRAAPWQTLWAYAIYALLLGAAIWGGTRWRVRTLHRRADELAEVVAQRTGELAAANQALRDMTMTDPLIGIRNRRFLDVNLPPQLAAVRSAYGGERRQAMPSPPVVLFCIVDLDHFKAINDTFGHGVGDDVLRWTGLALGRLLREEDAVVRWGGEEFLLVIHGSGDRVEAIAERIRAAIELGSPGAHLPRITCSIGIAPYPFHPEAPEALDWEDVVELADVAVYAAKHSGRNSWVAVLPGSAGPRADLVRRLREDPAAAAAAGEVRAVASVPPDRLRW